MAVNCLSVVSELRPYARPIGRHDAYEAAVLAGPECGSRLNHGEALSRLSLGKDKALVAHVAKIVATGFEYEINDDIKNGGLNAYLVRPVGYALYRLCRFLGERCLYVLVVLCASLITLLVMSALLGLIVRYDQVLGFSGILCLSVVLNYFIYFLVGMSAIWIGDASRLFGTINIVLIVVSGGIFPLDIFGDTVAKIVHLLPFVYTIQFPIDALCGRLGRAEGYAGVAIEVCWIGLLIGMAALTWHRGMRRYAAVGG